MKRIEMGRAFQGGAALVLFSSLVLSSLVAGLAAKTKPKDPPEILEIRKEFLLIEKELKNYQKKTGEFTQDAPGEGRWTTWSQNGKVRKLHTEFHADGASEAFDFYYREGELFFVFAKFESFPIWEDQENTGPTEQRYYLHQGKLIRLIYTSHENEMKPVYKKMGTKEFVDAESFIKKHSKLWLEFIKSGEKDFSKFMNG